MNPFAKPLQETRVIRWRATAKKILQRADELRSLSDDDLLNRSRELQYKARNRTPLQKLRDEAFAVVIETSDRVRNERHYEEQIMGALGMMQGHIVQMQTGEGKTLTATLPAYLRALLGRGCHVVTTNDYLAARDAEEMGEIYTQLGLRSGVVTDELEQDSEARREQYRRDITYGTVKEFGFDLLRDRLHHQTGNKKEKRRSRIGVSGTGVQRELYFALIDEADSVLLDEARTPLVLNLTQPETEEERIFYHWAEQMAERLESPEHFHINMHNKFCELEKEGMQQILLSDRPRAVRLFDQERVFKQVENSLTAHRIYKREREYQVRDVEGVDEVVIIDEGTGRPMEGRKWSEGLHQAIEVKERLKLSSEGGTAASITIQTLFRQYHHIAGMTGTAVQAAGELRSSYKTAVTAIPTHKKGQRVRWEPKIFATAEEKMHAIVEEIQLLATPKPDGAGRAVLVGTPSVGESEILSHFLNSLGIKHQVLNANNIAIESEIVKRAGQPGSVMIATNMAGRGTDIKLHETVRENGGLHVIATAMHSSARIDRQLFGRAARQGDPGSWRFFLSYQDDLLEYWPPNRRRPTFRKGDKIPSRRERDFAIAQRHLEKHHGRLRKANLKQEKERNQKVLDLGVDPFIEFIDQV